MAVLGDLATFSVSGTGLVVDVDEFDELTGRLSYAIGSEALTDLDWARVLYLVESSWASDLVGAGLDFATVTGFSDTEAVGLLRGLQRKIGGIKRANCYFRNGGRTPTAEEIEEQIALALQLRREQADGSILKAVTRQQRCKRLYPLR